MRIWKVNVNKRKVILIFIISFIIIFAAFTGIFIFSRSVVKQELERLNYPNSYETKLFSNTKEFYHGNWQASDPMFIVSEYYKKMDFRFKSGTSPSGPILVTDYRNINGVSCSIELFDIQNNTVIQFRIRRKHVFADLCKSIVLNFREFWLKLTGK